MIRSMLRVLVCGVALTLSACGKSPDALLSEAQAVRDKGDQGAAILQVKSLIQEHPEHVPARLFLGLLYMDAADYAGAEKELRRALDGKADPAQVLPALGKALLMQGEAKKLLAEISPDAIPDRKAMAKILALRGSAYLALRQKEEARKAFDEALAAKPGAPEALVGIARILAGERRWDEALAEVAKAVQSDAKDADALLLQGDLLRAIDKSDAAEQSYNALIAAHPSHVGGLLALISLTIASNRLDEANNYLASARKASPGNPMAAYFQALIAFRKSDFKAARDSIGAVLRVAPNHLPSVLLGGAIDFALGSQELAQTRLKFVLDRTPNNLYARRVLAASYVRAGQTQKALETLEPVLKGGIKDPAIFALAGEVFMQMNDFDLARHYFEQAATLNPQSAAMRTGLGLSRLAAGDVERATADLESASQLDTTRNRADTLLISTYLQQRRFDRALAAAESLVNKQPENPASYNLKAAALIGMNRIDAAREALEKAVSLASDYMPAVSNLAQLDLQAGDKAAARKRFEDIIARNRSNVQAYIALASMRERIGASDSEVQQWLDTARREAPGTLQPLVLLARFYLANNQPRKAVELVDRAVTDSPDNGEVLDLAGQIQLATGELNRAVATFSKWASLQPQAASPLVRLSRAQLALGQAEAAIGSLRKALSFDRTHVEAQLLLVDAEAHLGRIDEALKVADGIQKQLPKSALGWVAGGDALMREKRFAQAAVRYERGIALERSSANLMKLHRAMVGEGRSVEADTKVSEWLKVSPNDVGTRMYFAESLLRAEKHKRAIEEYQKLEANYPDNALVLNNLAWAYQKVSDKRALASAQRALKFRPDDPAVLDTYGWILVETGELQRGVETLKRAASLARKSPEIRLHYAEALLRASNRSLAKEELERLLVEFPKFPRQADAEKLLVLARQQP